MPETKPQPMPHTRISRTAVVMVVLIGLAMAGVVGRVVQLQVKPEAKLTEYRVRTEGVSTLQARRGSLLDRNGRPFAISELGQRLYADPKLITDWSDFAVKVSEAADLNPVELERALFSAGERRYVVLKELLTDAQAQSVQALKLPGLAVEPRPVRRYPQGNLASQVVGFVGKEFKGLDGLEFALDGVLSGTSGRVEMLRDVQRRPLWVQNEGFRLPEDGLDVMLSLDIAIQKIAEEEIEAAGKKNRAKAGQIIVMDSETGQLLAVANWPFFDTSNPTGRAAERARRNRCVTDPFEPGSIFKPFVHAAATSAGAAGVHQLVDCTDGGYWVTGFGRRLRDVHAHGTISWGKVLVVSSNIGMGKVGERFGAKRMHEAVRSFGFGSLSGVGLPGESAGIVVPLNKWTKYSVTSVPMGQEIAVTPMQLVRAFSAFANKGNMVSPTLLADETERPTYHRVLTPSAADETKKLMRKVVTEGTGKNALSDRYQIWGKTGTAQIPDPRLGYRPGAYTASFICGAPLKEPRIIVLVTVHEPDPRIAHYGGVVSAPVAKNVVERVLTQMNIAPDAIDDALPPGYQLASDLD